MSTSVLFDTLLSRLDSESLRSSLIEDGEELDDELVLQPVSVNMLPRLVV